MRTNVHVCVALLTAVTASCSEDKPASTVVPTFHVGEDCFLAIPNNVEVGDDLSTVTPFTTNKGIQLFSLSGFHNCGVTTVNGVELSTVMIGNQRWTTSFYSSPVDGFGTDWNGLDDHNLSKMLTKNKVGKRTFYYYPLEFALSFADVEAEDDYNLPEGFVAISNWHIPTDEEARDLWHFGAYSHNGYTRDQLSKWLADNLRLYETRAYYYNSAYVDVNQFESRIYETYNGRSVFWTSFRLGTTYELAGISETGAYSAFQNTRDSLMAPIRLVQTVKPIFDPNFSNMP